jgi:hypothetical protein
MLTTLGARGFMTSGLLRGAGRSPRPSHAPLELRTTAPARLDGRFGRAPKRRRYAVVGGSTTSAAKPASMRWEQDESGRVNTPFEPIVLAATLALIPVLILEADATTDGWRQVALVANWIIWAAFAVELAAVLIVAPLHHQARAC